MRKTLNFLNKLKDKIQDKIKTWRYSLLVDAENTVKFSSSSKVFNILGEKKAIKIGQGTIIKGELLTFKHGGEITIGKNCYVGENTRIWSASKIIIGDRVLISHNVNIHDNNAHPIDKLERHKQFLQISTSGHPEKIFGLNEKPIFIGDDAWIGFNSTIFKGVTIGNGSIVAACSVVTKNVPPNVIVAGNPSKIIKIIK